MTIGPENHSNGASTAQDRFSGGVSAFRQNRREAALAAEANDGELVTRSPQPLERGGSQSLERGGSQSLERGSSQSLERGSSQSLDRGGSQSLEPTGALDRAPSLPSLDMHGLSEPVFPSAGWMEVHQQAASMADHPLLRGLLLELPPRGAVPNPGWLDRWFEAARSILELLYVQEAKR